MKHTARSECKHDAGYINGNRCHSQVVTLCAPKQPHAQYTKGYRGTEVGQRTYRISNTVDRKLLAEQRVICRQLPVSAIFD